MSITLYRADYFAQTIQAEEFPSCTPAQVTLNGSIAYRMLRFTPDYGYFDTRAQAVHRLIENARLGVQTCQDALQGAQQRLDKARAMVDNTPALHLSPEGFP
jgi:hypothetical protein